MRNLSIWKNIDWITVLIYLLLVLLGWINIYAAVYNTDHTSIFDATQRYGKQILWIGAAIGLAFVILLIESNFYSMFAYVFYGATILLLVVVLFVGKEVNGARSWFMIGSFALQPAELAKFSTNLALAKYVSQFNFKVNSFKSYLGYALILLTPATLILLQNDTGSALVYAVFVLVLFREGIYGEILVIGFSAAVLFILSLVLSKTMLFVALDLITLLCYLFIYRNWKRFFRGVTLVAFLWLLILGCNEFLNLGIDPDSELEIASVIAALIIGGNAISNKLSHQIRIIGVFIVSILFIQSVDFVFTNVLEDHQRTRIEELLGIKSDPLGAGYNVNQSKIAIGSGGVFGKGFLQGTQTKFDFVPEQSTDFIFCTVGEEWGNIGANLVIALFLTLFLRLIILAERQRSAFSRIYGYGVASILFFHFAINIGMTIGLAPVIGIPLPFFSYGGSSLWSFTILLFIFVRLDANRMEQFQ